MANEEQLSILKQGVEVWNRWRVENPHAIIDPAIKKHNELRLIKAREPKIRLVEDFIDDKGLE